MFVSSAAIIVLIGWEGGDILNHTCNQSFQSTFSLSHSLDYKLWISNRNRLVKSRIVQTF